MLPDSIATYVSPEYKTEWCKHGQIFYYSYIHVISQDSLIFIVKKLKFWHKNRWIDFMTI